jgi:hypothetical protein
MAKTLLLTLTILVSSVPASAAVIYDFSFSNLSGGISPFTVTLEYPDYVTTIGESLYPGAPLATAVGYDVNYILTGNGGRWGFSADAGASISEFIYNFDGDSFLFSPSAAPAGGFFVAPGVYAGSVGGNSGVGGSNGAFGGAAVLTIRQTAVPEPATALLVASALGALMVRRRRGMRA